ncbi:MAG: FkbM family methyltransferase [Pseudomonadota bacterium]
MEIHSSRPFLGDDPMGIYQLLAHMPVRHCVDVGAAAGTISKLMRRQAPDTTIDAFEPFPGNLPFARAHLDGLRGVTLHAAAVGTQTGRGYLNVPSVVQGSEPGWEDKAGYSSLGALVETGGQTTIEVPVVSIDEAVPRHITFLKIDVQGTERDVLESAAGHFSSGSVDMCFVEWSAEDGLVGFFERYGWHVFYAPVLLIGRTPMAAQQEPGAAIVKTLKLSTGNAGEYIWPDALPLGADRFRDYLLAMKTRFLGAQTDLIAVAPHFMPTFLRAAAARIAAQRGAA